MGYDVFQKRCGCGRILKQRESCPTCAERARAELHARHPTMAQWDDACDVPYVAIDPSVDLAGMSMTPGTLSVPPPHWTDCYMNPPQPTVAGQAFIKATKASSVLRGEQAKRRELVVQDWQYDAENDQAMLAFEDGSLMYVSGDVLRAAHAKQAMYVRGLVALLEERGAGGLALVGFRAP